jgi:Uncharacterised nucleotidyltransferase
MVVQQTLHEGVGLSDLRESASRHSGPLADLVTVVFRQPERIREFDPASWDVLIRQSRRANLLARLAWVLKSHDLWDAVLPAARPHLESAWAFSQRQRIAVRWEIECIDEAIRATGIPLILLKGAGYVALDLPAAAGRLVSDVDILVPKDRIAEIESALMMHGWHTIHHDAYDQRYYRRWMHEIPPMRHLRRGTVIDVHHALLPETARIKVDSDAMRTAATAVRGLDRVFVLAPGDMVLHSAAHLFHEGELDNGLRDLVDLDSLLRHFGEQPGFWERLVPRAMEVGLARPLFYALRYSRRILGTEVPAEVIGTARNGSPAPPLLKVMDFLFLRALRPNHASCSDVRTQLARWMLYVRSHWLRMPLPLLLYHLVRKAATRRQHDHSDAREPTAPADRPTY